jgi:hypothetical protein
MAWRRAQRHRDVDVRTGVPAPQHADQAGDTGAQCGAHCAEEAVQGARHPLVATPQGEEPADAHQQLTSRSCFSQSTTGIM